MDKVRFNQIRLDLIRFLCCHTTATAESKTKLRLKHKHLFLSDCGESVVVPCQGVEVEFNRNRLAFGAVVQHRRSTKTVILYSNGDVGTR